jgi:hypothetical protein
MRKMTINGVPHLWKPLSFTNPEATVGISIIVAFPENMPNAYPIFLIDNNGTNSLGSMSYAVWIPTTSVHFSDADGQQTTW